jgi:hypothetical protein
MPNENKAKPIRFKVTYTDFPLRAPLYDLGTMTLAELRDKEDRERKKRNRLRDQERRQQKVINGLLKDALNGDGAG